MIFFMVVFLSEEPGPVLNEIGQQFSLSQQSRMPSSCQHQARTTSIGFFPKTSVLMQQSNGKAPS